MGCESSVEVNLEHKKLSDEDLIDIEAILSYWFPGDSWDRHSRWSKKAFRRQWMQDFEVDRYLKDNFDNLIDDIEDGMLEHWKADQ